MGRWFGIDLAKGNSNTYDDIVGNKGNKAMNVIKLEKELDQRSSPIHAGRDTVGVTSANTLKIGKSSAVAFRLNDVTT